MTFFSKDLAVFTKSPSAVVSPLSPLLLIDDLIFRSIGYMLIIIGGLEAYESTRRLRRKQKEMEKLKEELKTT